MSDEEYFKNRGIRDIHYHQMNIWLDHFNPKKILDIGCGMGNLIKAALYYEVEAYGCDMSVYAIDNAPKECKGKLRVGEIAKIPFPDKFADLVICYDVLEHLNENEVSQAINELKRVSSKWILASVCFIGDPNYPLDPSHKTYKSRTWWEHHFKKQGMKIYEVPNNFMFNHQLVIAEV